MGVDSTYPLSNTKPSNPPTPTNQPTQNGTELMKVHDPGLVAVNAVASLASTDRQLARAFVNELWGVRTPRGKYRYFSGVLVLLSQLQVSGHFRAWYP